MATVTLNPNAPTYYDYTGKSSAIQARVTTSYQGSSDSNTTRSEKPDGTGTKWFHFDQTSQATLSNGATTTLKSGFKQRANAN